MHPKFEPSSQPLHSNFQPQFQPELNDQELGGDEFTPAGKSPEQLVKRVQQRMKEGKKLTNQEMHWAFSHGGFYFHQQAGVHQQRMRMKEDAERKSEKQSESGSVSEGVKGDITASPVWGDEKGEGNFTASPVLSDVKGKGDITASPLVDASQEEKPLSVMEKKEAQKENGQVTPLDASQNAVEQPVLGGMQPKAEESGEEKRRKEGMDSDFGIDTIIQPDNRDELFIDGNNPDGEKEKAQPNLIKDDSQKVALSSYTSQNDNKQESDIKTQSISVAEAEKQKSKEADNENDEEVTSSLKNVDEELKVFKHEILEAKKEISKKENARISKIDQSVKQNSFTIDFKTSNTILGVNRKYDNAIKSIKDRLQQTQQFVLKNKNETIKHIKSDTELNIVSFDKQIILRQSTLVLAGDTEAKRLEKFRDNLLIQANKVTVDNKATLHRHADQLSKKYSWSKRISDIRTDMHKMAKSTGVDQFDETYSSLKEGLDEDTEEIAGGIREEAADNITSFPEGKDEAAKQMRQVRDLMIEEVNKFGNVELKALEKEANRIIGELVKAKSGVILDLSQKAKEAKVTINNSSTDLKESVKKTSDKNKASLDVLLKDVTNDASEQPDELTLEQIEASRLQLTEIKKGDDFTGNKLVNTAKINLKQIATQHVDSLTQTDLQVIDSIEQTNTGFNDSCGQYETNFKNGYATIRSASNEEMGKIYTLFLNELDNQIIEAKTEWSDRVNEAMPELLEKQQDMIAGQQQALLERMVEMSDEAERLSTAGLLSDIGHGLYELGAGLLGFLADLIVGLLIIIGMVILAVVVIAGIIALFAGVSFFTALGSVIAFLVVWGPIILKVLLVIGIAIGVVGSWKKFKKAFTDPNLTFGERMKLIGAGIGEAITTIGLGWLKFGKLAKFGKFTALFGEWKGLKSFFGDSKLGKSVVVWFGNTMSKATKMKESGFFTPQGITSLMSRFKTGQQMNKIFSWTNNQLTLLERRMLGGGVDADYTKVGEEANSLMQISGFKKSSNLHSNPKVGDGVYRQIDTGGLRGEIPLSPEQESAILQYIERYSVRREDVYFKSDNSMNTSYGNFFGKDVLYINTDVMPALNYKQAANSRVSWKGAIAHELEGHRAAQLSNKTQIDPILEEAQASIRAARYGLDLTSTERFILLRDAIERLGKAGIPIKNVKHLLWI